MVGEKAGKLGFCAKARRLDAAVPSAKITQAVKNTLSLRFMQIAFPRMVPKKAAYRLNSVAVNVLAFVFMTDAIIADGLSHAASSGSAVIWE